jgi:hypothetical protein
VTPDELLEPAYNALAEKLDKMIDEKIGKFPTNKEVAEELGSLFRLSGDLYDRDIDPIGALVVLEGAGLDSCSEFLGELHHRDQLFDEALEGEERTIILTAEHGFAWGSR